MNKIRSAIIDVILFAVLMTFILNVLGLLEVNLIDIFSYGLLAYGIVQVYFSFGTNRKGVLFINTIIFLSGVILYVTNHYNFLSTREIIFPSLLFLTGAGFFMLFIDETSNRAFLLSAVILVISFAFFVVLGRGVRIFSMANTFTGILLDYYPIFLILIGITVLVNRKKY